MNLWFIETFKPFLICLQKQKQNNHLNQPEKIKPSNSSSRSLFFFFFLDLEPSSWIRYAKNYRTRVRKSTLKISLLCFDYFFFLFFGFFFFLMTRSATNNLACYRTQLHIGKLSLSVYQVQAVFFFFLVSFVFFVFFYIKSHYLSVI